MNRTNLKLVFSKGLNIPKKEVDAIVKFSKWVIIELGLKSDVIRMSFLKKDKMKGHISTGKFDDKTKHIFIRKEDRALIDVLRTIAHEMEHLKQHEEKWKTSSDNAFGIDWKKEDDAAQVAGRLIKMFVQKFEQQWLYKY